MSQRKQTIKLGTAEFVVTEVGVVNRSEHINEYKLDDGSLIRVANPAMVVYRSEGKDPEGHPIYVVRIGTSVATVESRPPEENNGSTT